ncbi:sigma-70 family RNA polymerase sigma factor [Actinomadura barringtoniae]|uniref:Sigma-70 family RNA polymerase sigma factor n=1 Tax=Actinomadura barringtoniae TaxID=1427535 RepID=A0A939P8E6_9ACTN|nr:sigma-70 family RNA polymerase sigma factor [Actinomadura barringtoniae]MBO2447227.1 sigma-70 family RNA polymerase sigma factor [Actinomadura barringtoniae]
MPDREPLAEAFEAQRGRLGAVAYRMLGSHADAEDVVQEAWLRLSRQDATTIDNLGGWLTTVVGRISLDTLRSRRRRDEASYDDPPAGLVVTAADRPTPDEEAALADSVGLALMVVLESLRPNERLAFVLHDLFAVPFEEIGQILGKSAGATKMLASRARAKVRATERDTVGGRDRWRVVDAFQTAVSTGDFEGLLRVLDPEVKLAVDTPGGVVVTIGATKVASGATAFSGATLRYREVLVDGLPGFVSWREDGTPISILAFEVTGDRITKITAIVDPAKLASAAPPDPPAPPGPPGLPGPPDPAYQEAEEVLARQGERSQEVGAAGEQDGGGEHGRHEGEGA